MKGSLNSIQQESNSKTIGLKSDSTAVPYEVQRAPKPVDIFKTMKGSLNSILIKFKNKENKCV